LLCQFPGLLSERVGMAEPLLALMPEAGAIFDLVSRESGVPLVRLVAEGPEEELHADLPAALAVAAMGCGISRLLTTRGFRVVSVAGHSVGVTAALLAAGALELPAAVEALMTIDRTVGSFLEGEGIEGGAGVVVGLTRTSLQPIVSAFHCDISCENSSLQFVVTGRRTDLEAALTSALEAGALSATSTPTAKPMHGAILSPLMKELVSQLATLPMRDPALPVVSHLDGSLVCSEGAARELLACHAVRRIDWPKAIKTLSRLAPEARIVECGSGGILTRLAAWVDRSLRSRTISWESVVEGHA